MLHALHEMRGPDGSPRWAVRGYDADHSQQLLRWAETGEFPFPVEPAASSRFHRTVTVPHDTIAVVDCGHTENHPDITDSVLRVADLVLLHLTPSTADIERCVDPPVGVPIRDMVIRSAPLRESGEPPVAWALLNRTVPHAVSTQEAREWLAEEGWQTLTTTIGNRERYKQSIGAPVVGALTTEFGALVAELEQRGLIK